MTETLDLLDIAPAVAVAPAAAPVTALATIKTATLARFTPTETALKALAERYRAVAFDVSTPKGMAAAKAARHDLRENGRYAVQRIEKAVKDEVNDLKKTIAGEAERLVAIVKQTEDDIDALITARENALAEEKRKRDEAELARKVAHAAALEKISGYVQMAAGKPIDRIEAGIAYVETIDVTEAVFEEFAAEAARRKAATLDALRAMLTKAQEAKAERDRIEAQRVENERVAAEQAQREAAMAEQQRKLDEQAADLQRRQDEIVAQQRATDEALHRALQAPVAPTVTVGDTHAIVADAKTGEIHTIDGAAPPADEPVADTVPLAATPEGDRGPAAAETGDWLHAERLEMDKLTEGFMSSPANVGAMHAALLLWQWAERNNSPKALDEARTHRDAVLDRILPF